MEIKTIYITITNDIAYDRRMIRTANSLVLNGYNICVVGFNRFNKRHVFDFKFATKLLPLCIKKGKLSYIEINIRLFFFLLFKQLHVLLSVDMDTLCVGFLLSRCKHFNLIFDSHEWFSEVPELATRPNTKRIWRWLEGYLLPKIKTKYTVSQSIAAAYDALGYGTTHVIRNMPARVVRSKNTNIKKVIIYQGAVNVGRGLENLITAVKPLDVWLWIVGDGDLLEAIKQKIIAENSEQQVTLFGFVAPDQLHLLTQQATLGFNVLEPLGRNYQCSLANKFFDYINNEVPVITNNFEEYKRINDQYEVACLVDDCSTESIRSAIAKCLGDEAYYNLLKSNCGLAMQEFNWENESQKLLLIFKSLHSN